VRNMVTLLRKWLCMAAAALLLALAAFVPVYADVAGGGGFLAAIAVISLIVFGGAIACIVFICYLILRWIKKKNVTK
jgi:hypothetical protein